MSRMNFARLSIAFAALLLVLPGVAFAGATGGGAAAAYDFNNDTKSDFLLVKTAGANQNLIQTQLIDGTAQVGVTNSVKLLLPDYEVVGAGDFSGTGVSDILVRKTTSPNLGLLQILVLNAAGTLVTSSVFPALVDSTYSLIGIGDIDGNGKADLSYVKVQAPNVNLMRTYLFSDSGDRTIMSTGFPSFFSVGFVGAGVADIDGDGSLADIVATNPATGIFRAYLTATGGLTVSSSTFPLSTPTGYAHFGIAPFDANDTADFLFEKTGAPNVGLTQVAFIAPGGAATLGAPANPVLQQAGFSLSSIGDFDAMNQSDFSSRNTSTGTIRNFLLNATGTGINTSGFPSNPSTDYTQVQNAAVLP